MTITLPVTLNNETRQIEFTIMPGQPHRAHSKIVAIGRCGRTGTKRWLSDVAAWQQREGWRVDYTFYHLNRNTGRLIDWIQERDKR